VIQAVAPVAEPPTSDPKTPAIATRRSADCYASFTTTLTLAEKNLAKYIGSPASCRERGKTFRTQGAPSPHASELENRSSCPARLGGCNCQH
jgi:hypothetical protein